MGLDCSHDAFSGAYSSFNRLRQFVAKAVGGSFPPHEDKTLDRDYIYFDDELFDPEEHKGIVEFLHHSDCDGEISPEICKIVADDLEFFMDKFIALSHKEISSGHIGRDGGFVEVIKQFIKGCRLAYENNEPLLFR